MFTRIRSVWKFIISSCSQSIKQQGPKYGWKGLTGKGAGYRASWELNLWPTGCTTKSDPVNSCPYSPLNSTNCDRLNDGKMPKGPKRLNGNVVATVITSVCVCPGVSVCKSVIMKSHSKGLGAGGPFLISLGAGWNIPSQNLCTAHTNTHRIFDLWFCGCMFVGACLCERLT